MDWEEQKLDEDIQQIELLLQSATAVNGQNLHRQIEEVDSDDDEDQLHISIGEGMHNIADEGAGPSGLNTSLATGEGVSQHSDVEDDAGEEEEEEELGDTLETALKLNRAYQELLRFHMANVQELREKNAERQRIGQEQLTYQLTSKLKPIKEDVFAYPFFKDRWGSGPPKNQEAMVRDAMFPRIEPPRVWKIYQEEILLQCLQEQMRTKCLKDLHLRLRKLRQGGIAEEDVEVEKDLIYTIDCVMENFEMSDVPVEDVIAHADWLTIANNHLDGAFSTESCITMFRNICNPLINRSRWSLSEDNRLKELTVQHGHQNWSTVAEDLETNRSAFLCLQRYQQALNDHETATWSPDKQKALCDYMDTNLGKEDIVSWDRVAWIVGQMTPGECKSKWEQITAGRKRRWTEKEDQALARAVTMYGNRTESSRRWMFIAAYVKTRNSSACRDRWENRLNPEKKYIKWSLQEDKILYDYLVEYNADDEKSAAKFEIKKLWETHFPERFSNSITQRLRSIQRKISMGKINDEFFETGFKELEATKKNSQQRKADDMEDDVEFGDDNNEGEEGPSVRRSSRTSKHVETIFHEYDVDFLDKPGSRRGYDREEQSFTPSYSAAVHSGLVNAETGCVGDSVVENCIGQLLASCPVLNNVSSTLVSSLQNCTRLLLSKPSVDLHDDTVREILMKKHKSLNRDVKDRDSRLNVAKLKVIGEVVGKGLVATEIHIPKRSKPVNQSVDVEAEIVSRLMRPKVGSLSDEVSSRYKHLIDKSVLEEEHALTNLRTQYSKDQKLKIRQDLPYLLPPNQISLSAFYQWQKARAKLTHYMRYRKEKEIRFKGETCVSDIKETDAYKTLLNRVKQLFLLPAVLSRAKPDAVIFQAMNSKIVSTSLLPLVSKTGDADVNVDSSSEVKVALKASTSSTSGGSLLEGSSSGTSTVNSVGDVSQEPRNTQVQTSKSKGKQRSTTAVPVGDMIFNVKALNGRKTLPEDVVAIILKSLEKKGLGQTTPLVKTPSELKRDLENKADGYGTVMLHLEAEDIAVNTEVTPSSGLIIQMGSTTISCPPSNSAPTQSYPTTDVTLCGEDITNRVPLGTTKPNAKRKYTGESSDSPSHGTEQKLPAKKQKENTQKSADDGITGNGVVYTPPASSDISPSNYTITKHSVTASPTIQTNSTSTDSSLSVLPPISVFKKQSSPLRLRISPRKLTTPNKNSLSPSKATAITLSSESAADQSKPTASTKSPSTTDCTAPSKASSSTQAAIFRANRVKNVLKQIKLKSPTKYCSIVTAAAASLSKGQTQGDTCVGQTTSDCMKASNVSQTAVCGLTGIKSTTAVVTSAQTDSGAAAAVTANSTAVGEGSLACKGSMESVEIPTASASSEVLAVRNSEQKVPGVDETAATSSTFKPYKRKLPPSTSSLPLLDRGSPLELSPKNLRKRSALNLSTSGRNLDLVDGSSCESDEPASDMELDDSDMDEDYYPSSSHQLSKKRPSLH